MKRVMSIALCFVLLLSCAIPALAANDVPEEVMEATKSVVRILSQYRKGAATGSGFVIKNEPGEVLIATNNHVVEDNPTSISVWVAEDELVEAEIVFTTAKKDLCVLKITDSVDMQPLTLSKEDVRQGQAVYAVGYPGVGDILSDSVAHTSEAATITDGIISAIRTFTIEEGADPTKLLQINAAINPGNSGGPLFNAKGEVIGVNTYKVNKESQGIFGAVDISELWTLLRRNGIEIPEKEAEPVAAPKPFPVGIAVGAAGALVLLVVVIILSSRKKPKRKNHKQKTKRAVTLLEYLQNYPQGLGIGGAVSLLLPAGIALRNFHNDGKLHLEICPENILIGPGGASLKNPSGQEAGRYNSGFAAPEIYKAAGYGITSDIYSFAAVLYFAVTGKVPANSLQQDVLEEGFNALENAAFSQVLRKSMASSVLDRTQSMQEMIYSIAVFNVPEAAPKAAAPVVEEVPTSVTEAPVVVPVAEKEELPPPENNVIANPSAEWCDNPPRQKGRRKLLLPIGVALACVAIAAVVLLWKPTVKPEEPRVAATQETQPPTETTVPLTPEEAAYAEAEELLASGETAKAAIAFGKLAGYKDARERSFALWDIVAVRDTIGANAFGTMGLKSDGTAVLVGNWPGMNSSNAAWAAAKSEVANWTDIIAVSLGGGYDPNVVGLKADGTVVATEYSSEVEKWQDIVSICAGGNNFVVGLKADGTVVATSIFSPYNQYGQNNVSDWTDIVGISTNWRHTIGLKSDGTVVAVGNNEYGQCEVQEWQDIVSICAGNLYTIGLKADGTVVATSGNTTWREYGQCEVSDWSDIVAISSYRTHTVGIRSDGTLVTAGTNRDGGCNISNWKDIVAVAVGDYFTIGLKKDGTIVAAGNNEYGQCNARKWTDIKLPN